MARKRMRRRRDPNTPGSSSQTGGPGNTVGPTMIDGKMVHIRQINTTDEGVLYTHAISERPRNNRSKKNGSFLQNLYRSLHTTNDTHNNDDNHHHPHKSSSSSPSAVNILPPNTPTLQGYKSAYHNHHHHQPSTNTPTKHRQYTIAPKKRFNSKILNWCDSHHFTCLNTLSQQSNPDSHLYQPSMCLFRYINWTFHGSFTQVFLTFLVIYMVVMVFFAWLLLIAGNAQPACIVAAGSPFGGNDDTEDATRFSDAFALSWTTFTTVGYGMIYTAVSGDFQPNGPNGELATEPHQCTWVVFLCTAEAFLGLLYAGMCAAILFGKVNRVQSHANIVFSNSVCLQYEEVEEFDVEEEDDEDEDELVVEGDENHSHVVEVDDSTLNSSKLNLSAIEMPIDEERDEENPLTVDTTMNQSQSPLEESAFIDQFNGCPVLKFQVVNELCNEEGSEIVDAIMKVVGVKFKGQGDRITHSQYVRVNLVDFEHPFFSRVWHGVHILDSTSPLLTDKARQQIQANNGSWPSSWFEHPHLIQEKLDFEDLILTVAGVSNVSAVTVHAYKRYKIGDVLIGYNFAPLVFRDRKTGMLEVDLALANDVREQNGLPGEDLMERMDCGGGVLNESLISKKEGFECHRSSSMSSSTRNNSTIRIKPGKLNDVPIIFEENLTMKSSSSSEVLPTPKSTV
mmetsp:Transcript_1806/g.3052  ORF Transcript_1806/g.3052 Transcript_1806/m.3052 type:complete len:679 (+) Transcript_1806:263-2299(+)